jgi:predicted Zn-dependent peptidase
MVGVAAGSLPSKAPELLRVVKEELARVADSGLDDEEVARGKGQARGGVVLSLEDSGSRMTRLGEAELFQRRLLSVDEVLDRIEAVTTHDVHALAQELFTRPQTLATVGPRA